MTQYCASLCGCGGDVYLSPQNSCDFYGPKTREEPRGSFKVIFYLLPCKAKITLQGKNRLGHVNLVLVLKGLFKGSLTVTLQNENQPQGKNHLRRFFGLLCIVNLLSHSDLFTIAAHPGVL